MALRLTSGVRDAAVNAATAFADAGTGPATLKIYTGGQPATAVDDPTGTLLATFTLQDPAYDPSSDGAAGLNTGGGISAVAVNTGVAGWGRLANSDGDTVYDGLCGTAGTPEFLLNALSITAGQIIVLSAGSISVPSGE